MLVINYFFYNSQPYTCTFFFIFFAKGLKYLKYFSMIFGVNANAVVSYGKFVKIWQLFATDNQMLITGCIACIDILIKIVFYICADTNLINDASTNL